MLPKPNKILEGLMEACAEELGEHASSVQILCTYEEDGNSFILGEGAGNWYARLAMARHMVERDTAEQNAKAMREVFNPPDDEGEQWKQKQ